MLLIFKYGIEFVKQTCFGKCIKFILDFIENCYVDDSNNENSKENTDNDKRKCITVYFLIFYIFSRR